jgi:hypothetical protein
MKVKLGLALTVMNFILNLIVVVVYCCNMVYLASITKTEEVWVNVRVFF